MKLSKPLFLVALSLAAAPALVSAQAQSDVQFVGYGSLNYNGLEIGPYQLQTVGGPVFDVFCIDPSGVSSTTPYRAWVSQIGRTGMENTKNYVRTTFNPEETFEVYWETAWLATQFEALIAGSNPFGATDTNETRAALQGALWEVGGYTEGTDIWASYGVGPEPSGIQTWIDRAVAARVADESQINGEDWAIITATNGEEQEFIAHYGHVSPEPATLILLGTGLIGVLGVGYRRQRLA